jgi:hypothetical protein
MKYNIIVLGNDTEINDLDLTLLYNKNCIITGVNRIYLKIDVDYLFFLDNILINEFYGHDLSKTIAITTNYNLYHQKSLYNSKYLKENFKEHIHIPALLTQNHIFGSLPSLMVAMQQYLYKDNNLRFFLLGTSLVWNDHSHFWQDKQYSDNLINNQPMEKWYNKRFTKIRHSLRFLQKIKRYNIISCHKNATRLDFLRNISYDHLLKEIS